MLFAIGITVPLPPPMLYDIGHEICNIFGTQTQTQTQTKFIQHK